jgi:hypothetical protein
MTRYTNDGSKDWPGPDAEVHVVSGGTGTYGRPKKRRMWPWVALLAALVLVCAGGITLVVGNAVKETSKELQVPPIKPAVSPSKPTPGLITEGVWEVGSDTGPKAGTYRVVERLVEDSLCYWQVSEDSAGQNIVSNDNPTGGTPQVTLKKGQWFKTQGCGEWKRLTQK